MYYWNLIVNVGEVFRLLGAESAALRLAGAFNSHPLADWSIVGGWAHHVLNEIAQHAGIELANQWFSEGQGMSARDALILVQTTATALDAMGTPNQ